MLGGIQIHVNLLMTGSHKTDTCIRQTNISGQPGPIVIKQLENMCMTDFAYDRPVFLVPRLSNLSSPVVHATGFEIEYLLDH